VLAAPHAWHWVLAIADDGLDTPAVYDELDRLRAADHVRGPSADHGAWHEHEALLAALRQRRPEVLATALSNDLQVAAVSLRPALADTLAAGLDAGALAGLVSGSGPTCVFLATDSRHAIAVAAELEEAGVARSVCTAAGPVPGARVI
jgi:4-diphosphocytidyl-2-C-methyl-D-erythritol kinase